MLAKKIDELDENDLAAFPVWQFVNDDSDDETIVRPVKAPAKNFSGKVVATQIELSNGQHVWALLGNVDISNTRLTQHFLTASVRHEGRWFTMARYHDFDSAERGPQALSDFLKLSIDEVFPILYDIRDACVVNSDALVGKIEKLPKERLTRAEIIALAVP